MKRREFLINSTLVAGGLALKPDVLSGSKKNFEMKSAPVDQVPGSPAYSCSSMPEGYFELLPQEAVRYSKFPVNTKHNAIWDFNWGHNGKMYVALCGELGNALSAILFEYDRATGKMEYCFDTARETMLDPRMIPPSKIHTSINPIRDGKVIMATHTTARSAVHKYWLFDQHYTHMWEGFPGAHVLVWDPATRQCSDLGVPVARDSIYGACYDDRNNALWFSTYLRGHLCRLDLESRKVKDFGQITEYGSYKFVKDRLGNMLISTRSGTVFHISVDDYKITDLGVLAKDTEEHPLWRGHRILAHHADMPDGRIMLGLHWSQYLYAYDPETLQFEKFGDYRPASFIKSAPWMMQKGLAFDSKGILWQTTLCPINEAVGIMAHLYRWDILKGKEPEYVGLVGTPERVVACVSEMHIDNNDVLHIADSNHGDDMPGVVAVDTRYLQKRLDDGTYKRAGRVRDVTVYLPYSDGKDFYPLNNFDEASAPYMTFKKDTEEYEQFLREQAEMGVRSAHVSGIRLWRQFGRGTGSFVQNLQWKGPGTLILQLPSGTYSTNTDTDFQVLEKTDHSFGPTSDNNTIPDVLKNAEPPARQGRRFKTSISAWARWDRHSWIIGTDDGCIALYNEKTKSTFSLGAVGVHGPVHQIAVAKGHAYGVSGDPNDLGNLFHYDAGTGLREIGRTVFSPEKDPIFSNTQPFRVAVSPDGERVAVSVADMLGCVYVYESVWVI